jgi:hypothetical protein
VIIEIICTEDGDKYFKVYTEAEYLESLNCNIETGQGAPDFLMPNKAGEIDLDSAAGTILIRGEVIKPRAVETVSRFTL